VARLLPRLAYHSRHPFRDGQMVFVIRCRQRRRTFCDRYGTAFYDLKTPEENVQRAIQQGYGRAHFRQAAAVAVRRRRAGSRPEAQRGRGPAIGQRAAARGLDRQARY